MFQPKFSMLCCVHKTLQYLQLYVGYIYQLPLKTAIELTTPQAHDGNFHIGLFFSFVYEVKNDSSKKGTKIQIYIVSSIYTHYTDPVIYLHGLMGGVFNCAHVFSRLSRQYRMIMPFQPMYDLPKEQTNCASLAAYLATFMDDLSLSKATIIGHSTGGSKYRFYTTQKS